MLPTQATDRIPELLTGRQLLLLLRSRREKQKKWSVDLRVRSLRSTAEHFWPLLLSALYMFGSIILSPLVFGHLLLGPTNPIREIYKDIHYIMFKNIFFFKILIDPYDLKLNIC